MARAARRGCGGAYGSRPAGLGAEQAPAPAPGPIWAPCCATCSKRCLQMNLFADSLGGDISSSATYSLASTPRWRRSAKPAAPERSLLNGKTLPRGTDQDGGKVGGEARTGRSKALLP